MRNLTARVLIALITFTLGTIVAAVWLFYPARKSDTPGARDVRPQSRNESDRTSRGLLNHATPQAPTSVREEFGTIEGTIGVLVVKERSYGKGDSIHFYNEDGSLWHKLTPYYDDTDGKAISAFKCVGKEDGRYEIIFDEETGLRKYVKADDPFLILETWEEHILNVRSVRFNQAENPLLEAPQGRVKRVALSDALIQPVEVKGEWLKVKWGATDGAGGQIKKRDRPPGESGAVPLRKSLEPPKRFQFESGEPRSRALRSPILIKPDRKSPAPRRRRGCAAVHTARSGPPAARRA